MGKEKVVNQVTKSVFPISSQSKKELDDTDHTHEMHHDVIRVYSEVFSTLATKK